MKITALYCRKLDKRLTVMTLILVGGLLIGCSKKHTSIQNLATHQLPILITSKDNFVTSTFELYTQTHVRLNVDLETNVASERLTITSAAPKPVTLLDSIDIPTKGANQAKGYLGVLPPGNHTIRLTPRHGHIKIHAISITPILPQPTVTFRNASQEVGLAPHATWKYGGPSVADVNNDGFYDFLLSNHHEALPQLFINNNGETISELTLPLQQGDFHGTAIGDYDSDGDLDLLIARGGGNGTQPTPPMLFNNRGTHFVDATESAGISKLGARGRSVRFIDIDVDGDLDILLLNARKLENERAPRNLLISNNGDGTFHYTASPLFESTEAERVLVTDFDHNNIPDLITYSPLTLLKGNGDFSFEDVSAHYLPSNLVGAEHITGAVEFDINNDGLLDYYFSRGMVYYELANYSLEFTPDRKRIDLREAGHAGENHFDFEADDSITLVDFFHWFRGYKGSFPVFLGKQKTLSTAPTEHSLAVQSKQAEGWPTTREESGWYLGHLGGNRWRFGWKLNDAHFWGIRASITGATALTPSKPVLNSNIQDLVLLSNETGLTDISHSAGAPSGGNHQGVTTGDFNNDGYMDLFVYRFGLLTERVSDWLLINTGNNTFTPLTQHGATATTGSSHGDMGQAFDFNLDGKLDLLSGDDNAGSWHLFLNDSPQPSQPQNYALIRVCNSPSTPSVDPNSAIVTVSSGNTTLTRHVRSAGEIHSQSLLNTVHIGLGGLNTLDRVQVQWRNGRQQVLYNQAPNQLIAFGCD